MSRIESTAICIAALLLGGCLSQSPPDEPAEPPADRPPATDGGPSPDAGGDDPQPEPAPEPDPAPPPALPAGVVAHDEATDAAGGHSVDPHQGPVRVAYLIDDVGDQDWLRFELPVAAPVAIRVRPLGPDDRCDGMATLALFAADEPDPRATLQAERPGHCPTMVPRDDPLMRRLPAGIWQVRVGDLGWQKQQDDAPENVVEVEVLDPLAEGEPCLAEGELRACDEGLFCDVFGDAPVCVRAGCGDGFVDADTGEQCDDGNGADGDGCSADCVVEDGDRGGVGEACDRDLDCAAGTVCRGNECRAPVCGDGVIDAGEECEGGAGCVACRADVDAPRNVEPDEEDAPYRLDVADGFDEVGFTLAPAGDVDWFSFTLAEPAAVSVQTRGFRGEGCEGDTVIELFGPDRTSLGRNDDRFDGQERLCSLLDGLMLEAGVYTVRVDSFGGRPAGLNLLQVRLGEAGAVGDPCDALDPAAQCAPGAVCIDGLCAEARCGDGIVSGDEQCDDGNAIDGDGCDACRPTPAEAGEPCWQLPCAAGLFCAFDATGEPTVCAPIVCGDGFVSGDEQCDDGNDAPGDGCDACAFEVGNVEPDDADAPFLLDLAEGADAVDFVLDPAGDEDWFAFDLDAPARLVISTADALDPTRCAGDTVLELFDVRVGFAVPLARDDDSGVGFCSRIGPDRHPVVDPLPAGNYTIRASAFGLNAAGLNRLSVRILAPAPVAGEGCDPLDPLRACDDGTVCGEDGVCRDPICGDGVAEGAEQCDDGNADDADGCTVECLFAPAAIGQSCWVEGNQRARVACVEGAYCRFDGQDPLEAVCQAHVCGDGVLGPDEECDAGDALDAGCAADCTFIPLGEGDACGGARPCDAGLACDPAAGQCVVDVCGNGLRGVEEQCDDGNLEDGDGCDAACVAEPVPAIEGSGDYLSLGIPEDGVDRFPLTVNGPAVGTFETTGADGDCPGDTLLRVLDADGAPLAEDDDGGVFLCSLLAVDLEAGDYTVEVSGWHGRAVPAYLLRVTLEQLDPDQPL